MDKVPRTYLSLLIFFFFLFLFSRDCKCFCNFKGLLYKVKYECSLYPSIFSNTNNYGKSQLDLYLEESRTSFEKFDVLGYWKYKSNRFNDIVRMTFDVLSIPITILALESAFSIDSLISTQKVLF